MKSINTKDLADAHITQKQLDGVYPSSGQTSFKDDASERFSADKNPRPIFIINNGEGLPIRFINAGKEMATIVYKMVPALGAALEVV